MRVSQEHFELIQESLNGIESEHIFVSDLPMELEDGKLSLEVAIDGFYYDMIIVPKGVLEVSFHK